MTRDQSHETEERTMLRVVNADGCGLQLRFLKQRDRYSHRLTLIHEGKETDWLQSLEGDPEQRWPPSPPLQQLSWMTSATGSEIALLVGMAGRSHWSMSVEANATQGEMVFDVASRIQQKADWLGSSYRSLATHVRAGDPTSVAVGRVQAMLRAGEPGTNAVVHESSHSDTFQMVPRDGESAASTTVRWKYSVCWVVK